MLRLFQICYQGSGGTDRQLEALNAEPLEALDFKLPAELLHGGLVHKSPLVQRTDVDAAEHLPDRLCEVAPDHYFFRGEGVDQGADIVLASLGDLESAGGDVEEGGAHGAVGEIEPA